MPRESIEPEQFLTRLTACFSDPSSSETVWLTHKRYAHDVEGDVTMVDESREYDVLLRCTHGTTKFSTRIPPSQLQTFQSTYSNLLKSSLAPSMRKRDKKREKAKAEAVLKKRKEAYVDVVIGDAGKRGAGRRQRQRKVAAQRKKEEEREKIEAKEAKQRLA